MLAVDYDKLVDFIQCLYEKAGVCSEHARYQAENVVSCEAKGIWSHGVGMAKRHLEDVVAGKINLAPKFKVLKETASTAKIDGDNGLGAAVAVYAVKYAVKKAKESGSACVAVTGGNHFGAGHYYAELAVKENCIVYMYTTGDATMAPFGGIKRYYGTNPYTYAAPAGKYPPYILDMATTVGAARKVQQCVLDGTPAPVGWGIDQDGNETTDAEAILDGGAMLPFGGPKGYGLAGMIDIMGGVLNEGAAYRDDICCMPIGGRTVNNGFFIQVIDVASFMEMDEFNKRMETMCGDLSAIPPRPGFQKVFYPGLNNAEEMENAKKNGVVLNETALNSLKDTAALVHTDISVLLKK